MTSGNGSEASRLWTHRRDLMYELVCRDMKLRYKRSVLGFLWSLLNPLAYLLVFTFLFRKVIPLDIPSYPLFVFTGVLAWGWFSSSLNGATASVTNSREFVHQPAFPLAVLPAVAIFSNLIHFLIAFVLLFVVLVLTGRWLSFTAVVLPVIFAIQFSMTLALGYFFSTLNVRFRDTSHLLQVALMLGFFLTPIFYQARAVPEAFQSLYRLNPMMHIIGAYRDIIIYGRWPDGIALAVVAGATLPLLWLGYRIFTHASHNFAEEL